MTSRLFDRALGVLAALLLASMLAAALHDVSQAWDVWYYHLPFAARLGGVLGPVDFVFSPENQARFEGYPRLGELLQGLLWRITGRAESANLVAFAAVPLLAWFLHRRFRVPPALTILALFAVPLVQLHATSCYVDLPGNTAAAVLVLLAHDAYAGAPAPVSSRSIPLACLSAGVAVNTRFQLHPLVLLAGVAFAVRALPPLFRDLRAEAPSRSRARCTLAAIAVALPFVFATPLVNLAVHHNPYYPEHLRVLGRALPGPEEPYEASPHWLAHAPRPARFAASLLEIGVRPFGSRRRWTMDQWMPDDSDGPRMGGFFNAYVVAQLALLAFRIARDRSRPARTAAVIFAALTALIALMPQSHELRYYQVWMIVLVSLNLVLACRPPADPSRVLAGPRTFGVLSLAALGVVLIVTHAGYVYPTGSTFAEIVQDHVPESALRGVHDGDRLCAGRDPWNLLWASAFHPPRRYSVKEGDSAKSCGDYRPPP